MSELLYGNVTDFDKDMIMIILNDEDTVVESACAEGGFFDIAVTNKGLFTGILYITLSTNFDIAVASKG